jgi:inosine-uridine nucleoside N-ribohydrolase
MKILRHLLSCGLLLAAAKVQAAPAPGRPVAIIFDTDMGNDVDDALALGMIHALETRGACKLLAVTLTNPEELAGRYVDAVNTFYGRGDIPVGVNPEAPKTNPSKFLKVATATDAAGKPVFPHDLDPARAPRAVPLLRKVLAAAGDQEVVIVQVGFFSNLAALLDSPGDELSPLAGRELVARKVRLLSAMAGAFQTVNGNNHILEYNVRIDVPRAQKLAKEWPTPIVWSGWEIGMAITFPAWAVDRDFGTKRHPLPEAYQLYNPTPHERPCWDLTSVLQAVYPDRGYYTLSAAGRVTVENDGFTTFVPAKPRQEKDAAANRDRFMIVDPVQAGRNRELFAALAVAPTVK